MEICYMNNEFIKQSPNPPPVWEISKLGKMTMLRQLDICFNALDAFIETVCSFNSMHDLQWIYTNKMKFKNEMKF